VFISDLTEVEVSSALSRWCRMRELDENQAQNIENKFAEHLTQGLFTCSKVSCSNAPALEHIS
jgi:hypothetical protein